MAKFSTPGVYPKEIDISEVVSPEGIGSGGIVLRSSRGRANIPIRITNDKNLIDNFGAPLFTGNTQVPEYGYGLYAALEFLKESNDLTIVRVVSEEDKYAGLEVKYDSEITITPLAVGDGIPAIPTALQPNPDKIDSIKAINDHSFTDKGFLVTTIGPGIYGKNIAVGVEFLSPDSDWLYNYDEESNIDELDDFTDLNTSKIEDLLAPRIFKLTVYVKNERDEWDLEASRNTYVPVEAFYVSLENVKDENGNSLEITDVINGNSNYIYIKKGDILTNTDIVNIISLDGSEYDEIPFYFSNLDGGVSQQVNDLTGTQGGWNYFVNKSLVDVDTLIVSTHNTAIKQYVNSTVIGSRMDCFMIAQSGSFENDSVESIRNSEDYGYTHPSYVGLYCGYGKIRDQFNDKYVWIPNVCFAGSAIVRTDNVSEPWFSPAGDERGIVPSIEQNVIFNDSELGILYDNNINPIKYIRGTGYVIWGQKTAQRKATARNRINVRRTLLYIEKTINRFLESLVFNVNNTEITRLRVTNNIDNFLDGILAADGLTSKEVVCNETNNTSQVIDNNELAVDIYLQPVRTVEFISVNYVITRTGISFSEVRVR